MCSGCCYPLTDQLRKHQAVQVRLRRTTETKGRVAEWSGTGLQNLSRRFDSAHDLIKRSEDDERGGARNAAPTKFTSEVNGDPGQLE